MESGSGRGSCKWRGSGREPARAGLGDQVATVEVLAPRSVSLAERTAATDQLKHFPELDGARGLAIGLVLVLHFLSGPRGVLQRLAGAGWIGVDLFFVLSGFLITRILLSALGSTNYFRNFYARRALRIWPLYYTVLAFAFLGTKVLPSHFQIDPSPLPFYLTFTQNLVRSLGFGPWAVSVTWSLAIEEQFYLVWPLCVRFMNASKLFRVLIALLIFAPTARFVALLSGELPVIIYTTTWFRVDALAAGALTAISLRSALRPTIERLSLPVMAVALLGAGGLCVAHYNQTWLMLERERVAFSDAVGFSLVFSLLAIGFSALVVQAVSAQPGLLRQALRSRPLRFMGKISFGLYLFNGIVVPLAQELFKPWLHSVTKLSGKQLTGLVALAGLLGTFGLATISWHVLESPILRLRRLFPARSKTPATF